MESFKVFVEADAHTEHEVLNLYYSNHHKVTEISELTGVSAGGIYRILQKHNISPNRMTPGQYETIYHFADTGVPAKRIAELSGYSLRQVYNILKDRPQVANLAL